MPDNLVSVIIPVFNRETLICETLDSVLAQTFCEWEAIVVDDGSTDKTCESVKAYSDKDKRIKLIERNRDPKGASVCRNIGIEHATGKYLIFLDSDDLLTPTCLAKRVHFMNSHPQLDFAVFQMNYFNRHGIPDNLERVKKRENYLYAYLRHDLPWNITCPLWRSEFIKNNLYGYNEAYPRLQDPEFNTRALMVNDVKFEVLFDSEADCCCRVHTAKIFSVGVLLAGFKLYIEEFSQRIKKIPDYLECKHQLKQSYIEAVRAFYSYYKPEWHDESITLLAEINRFACNDGLISRKTHRLTSLLIRAYKARLTNVSWGKYVLRAIMKLIKMS